MQIANEPGLNPECIRVLSWNVMKQAKAVLNRDLGGFSSQLDLALLQEVHVEGRGLHHFNEGWHRSFAPGFRLPGRTTGVMTLSNAGHRSENCYIHPEPLLRTPKAANLTTYGLEETDAQLLVINLHAINFSLGMRVYRRQLTDLLNHMDNHEGPVIFAGDFNAWHDLRRQLLDNAVLQHGLHEVEFEEDNRTRLFGRHLDYMFVRGLDVLEARSHHSDGSDHNPLLATVRLR